jgi:capsular exopolysaccharide synthesis family protein
MPENTSLRTLPPPVDERTGRNLPVPIDMYRVSVPGQGIDLEPEEAAVPLSHYLWILRRQWWKILAFVILAVAGTVVASKRMTPIYESITMVDIDRQLPPGIIGQDALRTASNDADQFIATQIRLIQSDSVLRPVADRFGLRDLERESSPLGGAEPAAAPDAPVVLKKLKITRPPNTYLLQISYRSKDPNLAAGVANAVAQSYLEHTYNIRIRSSASLSSFMEQQLEELKAKMERSSSALAQFERELNVINPEEKTSILSARLLQLNTEYTNAQTDRVRKESAYNSVRGGTLEAAQVSTQGEALRKLTERLDEAQQRFAEVKVHYGANHPEYRKAATQLQEVQQQLAKTRVNTGQRVEVEWLEAVNREGMLKKAVGDTKNEFDRLNARSFEYQSLKREADADKKLYEELVRKIKEAGINAGFQNSSIRIADRARPAAKPVSPNLPLNVGLAFLFSTLIAIGAAVIGDLLNNTVRQPEDVSRGLGAEVIGLLPAVKDARMIAAADGGANALVAASQDLNANFSGFDEAIRTLRNAILLSDFDHRLRSLMITSSSPAEGKSTIISHLAIAHAQQGRKTLLIDADLRRPSVHRQFGIENKTGLSSVLNGEVSWQEVVAPVPITPNLHLLPAGRPSRRAADLIGIGLTDLLESLCKEYDLVLLDTPPLLGFPEPLQMAAAVDGVLMVALSGQTNRKALGAAINMLSRLRSNIVGVVINCLRPKAGDANYYYQPRYYRHYSDVQ